MSRSRSIWVWAAVGGLAVGVGLGLAVTESANPVGAAPEENALDDARILAADSVIRIPQRIEVPIYSCPGAGVAGSLRGGDRVLATAVDASGAWVAIRSPENLTDRVWVAVAAVTPDQNFDSLPVRGCPTPEVLLGSATDAETTTTTSVAEPSDPDDPAPAPAPTPDTPSATTTAPPPPGPTPPAATTTQPPTVTPSTPAPPTNPTTTAAPTTAATTTTTAAPPPPDTAGPALSASASPTRIWEDFPGLCAGEPKTATISASASDPSGVASITASWTVGGSSPSVSLMSGPATFGPVAYGTAPAGGERNVTVTIRAVDNVGNATQRTVTITVVSADTCFG